jgi:hypothetical protein
MVDSWLFGIGCADAQAAESSRATVKGAW